VDSITGLALVTEITFWDGTSEVSDVNVHGYSYSRLFGQPLYDVGYSRLWEFFIAGTGVIDGQKGRFKAYIDCRGVCYTKNTVKHIQF
jgi:hypothetical protein